MPSLLLETQSDLPTTQTAIKQAAGGELTIALTAPIPPVEPGTAIVRTAAVGLNPTDYKIPSSFPTPGATAGCDYAGVVVQISHHVPGGCLLQVGDRVCGGIQGSNPADKLSGSFAQYVRVPVDLLVRLPDHVTWEQGAALGMVGHATVAQALWSCFGLRGTPEQPLVPAADLEDASGSDDGDAVLVYGASTATGTMAIQLLRLSGYRPIAVCSPRNFALARRYGATAVFDYTSPTCGAEIRAYTSNALWYALDCISDRVSAEICYGALGRAGGRYVCLEAQPAELLAARRAVRSEFLMSFDMAGKGVALPGIYGREPHPERHALGKVWVKSMERLLEERKIAFHPIKVLSGEWQGILDGLDMLQKGKVSATKLVVTVS